MTAMVPELIEVTPSQAAYWLKNNLYSRQRTVREWHVRELAFEMENGRFIAGTPIAFAVLNGVRHLVNGQHTLSAIVESGKTIALTVLDHPVRSAEEIADLYSRYDRHMARSINDILVAQDMPSIIGIPMADCNRLSSAITLVGVKFAIGGARYQTAPEVRSADVRKQLMIEYAPYAKEYFSMLEGVPREHYKLFRRAVVIAFGLLTIRYVGDVAGEFWRATALDDGLKQGDPRKTLLKWLIAYQPKNPDYDARCISLAWNAFYEGRQLQLIRVLSTTPLKIAGTPINERTRQVRKASATDSRADVLPI